MSTHSLLVICVFINKTHLISYKSLCIKMTGLIRKTPTWTTKAGKTLQTMRSFDSLPPVRVISFFTGSTGTLIHNMREIESEEYTTHCSIHPLRSPPRLVPHDGMQLFLNMPSLGSLMCTPFPQSPVLWIAAPPHETQRGVWLRSHRKNQLSMNIEEAF